MTAENRPASPQQAPDPATNYERARPENEAGMGRLDDDATTPTDDPDRQGETARNRQDPTRQINAEDVTNQRAAGSPQKPKQEPQQQQPSPQQPDHSMHEEEPDGWDQAPTDIHDPKQKRHPRTEGRGGTP